MWARSDHQRGDPTSLLTLPGVLVTWRDPWGLPRDGDGCLDGFSVITPRVSDSEWRMRRDDPTCSYPARPRTSYPAPVECRCGAVFCPLRTDVLYCSLRCCWRAQYHRHRDAINARRRARRKARPDARAEESNRQARERRRQRRAEEPAFREAEARWAREYRKRKRAT